jgi:hypothetical protein
MYNHQNFEPELEAFIDHIFAVYDTDKSGVLEMN